MAKSRVKNMKQVNKKLNQLAQGMTGEQLATILEVALMPVLNDAKIKAPVDSGNLRRSYRIGTRASDTEAEARVGTNILHGPFQEFGTVHQPGTPHLRPSWDKNEGKVVTAVAEGIKETQRKSL